MSVGVIQHDLNDMERQVAYAADITYGTNNEFGFDYLRDNMKFELAHYVQRGHHFAIVDEVDSILIDEARTPLIISGPAEQSTDLYYEVDRIIPRLKAGAVVRGDAKAEEREALEATGDYIVDEKHKTVTLTESGTAKAEQMLTGHLKGGHIYDLENAHIKHHVDQALRAHTLYHEDVEYMVKEGEVVIVDEFTGRLMPGRRWSDGLHQAVEAKEKVKIERENQTLATVTFQNYFRKYKKLSGMTGTADTEAEEFAKIYKLDVIVIPPNRKLLRIENPDLVYRTEKEKWDAIVTEIVTEHEKGRPVLVGTVSIEKSERLSTMLDRRGLKRGTTTGGGSGKHVVLNAKYHAQEAEFVAQAGRKGSVTIATNMAGRGTDILLGGNPEFMTRQQCLAEQIAERLPKGEERFVDDDQFVYYYHLDGFYRVPKPDYDRIFQHFKSQTDVEHEEVVAANGLHILGTERHEARRIDNQLRGRAGRQGDPGSSRFYLSLEDDLMRIFGSDRIAGLMQRLGMEEGVPIEHGMVSKAIERAQKQVEAQNFSVRKHLLEYDDVMNKQRENIYTLRRQILEGKIKFEDAEGNEEVVGSREYLMSLAEDTLDSLDDHVRGQGRGLRRVGPRCAEARGRQRLRARPVGRGFLRSNLRRDRRPDLGAGESVLSGEGSAGGPRGHGARRARRHAPAGRPAVEGSSLQPRSPEGRHRPSRVRAARSAGRVQAGKLRDVPGHEAAGGRRDRPVPVAAEAHDQRGRRRSAGASARSAPPLAADPERSER